MMLQAKAIVTAEALDLVLYPEFQFNEEARPIVAREVARRATPRRLLDRVWSGLAEFVLLGEVPPPGAIATGDLVDERRFRREVLKALAYSWAEDADDRLREKQADVDRYTSAGYWQEHPELQAALQTGLGFLHLLTMQLDRALWASEREPAPPVPEVAASRNGTGPEATTGAGPDRYAAFRQALDTRGDKGRPYTSDMRQMTGYWEEEARAFPSDSYWGDKQTLNAGLKSGLDLLRLFAGQVAQAVEAGQEQDEAADPAPKSDEQAGEA